MCLLKSLDNQVLVLKSTPLLIVFSTKRAFIGYKIDTISPYNINRLNLLNLNYHSAGYSGGLSGPWQDWLASMQVLFTPVS